MNVRHSSSLLLIWQVAEFEARQLRSSTIKPIHLLLGLSKAVDLDLTTLVSKDIPNRDEVLEECLREVRRLRHVFQDAELNPATFRRRLRRASEERRFSLPESERLHRSDASKIVFAVAEQVARLNNSVVYPIHLFYAVLGVEDERRDQAMKERSLQEQYLWKAVKDELFFQHDKSIENADRTQWN